MLPEALQRRIHDEQQRMWGHISAKQNSSSAGSVKGSGMCRAWCVIKLVFLVCMSPTLAGAAMVAYAAYFCAAALRRFTPLLLA
jgi:hypothetical protein